MFALWSMTSQLIQPPNSIGSILDEVYVRSSNSFADKEQIRQWRSCTCHLPRASMERAERGARTLFFFFKSSFSPKHPLKKIPASAFLALQGPLRAMILPSREIVLSQIIRPELPHA
ncbi:hypothetical protein VNO77_14832 [Canavalia gladiata]|uniref:Uncharacterized protein n=1 Tax=Canavalia gladiata TaxID=3824 RepID=A0AAN9LZ53_CANGL